MKTPPYPELGNPPTPSRGRARRSGAERLRSWLIWLVAAVVVAGALQEARGSAPVLRPVQVRHIPPGSPLLNPPNPATLLPALDVVQSQPSPGLVRSPSPPAQVLATRPTPFDVRLIAQVEQPSPSPLALPATWSSSTPVAPLLASATVMAPQSSTSSQSSVPVEPPATPRPTPTPTSSPRPTPSPSSTPSPTPTATPTAQPCVPKASEARGQCRR